MRLQPRPTASATTRGVTSRHSMTPVHTASVPHGATCHPELSQLSWSERGASASMAAEMSAIVGIKIWAVSDRPDAPDRSDLPDASAVVLSISPP